MKRLWPLLTFLPLLIFGQELSFKPNNIIDITVGKTYYDTKYIYITNIGENIRSPQFELVSNTLLTDWSQTACTNIKCYTDIPKAGTLGDINAGEEAFFSINLSTNQQVGQGELIYIIYDKNTPDYSDTLKFIYTVTETGKLAAQPWAKIDFQNRVLNVLLQDPFLKATLLLSTLEGKPISNQPLSPITSFPLYDYPKGVYLLVIQDEKGREIKQRIVNF
jgi:hypothetical protein